MLAVISSLTEISVNVLYIEFIEHTLNCVLRTVACPLIWCQTNQLDLTGSDVADVCIWPHPFNWPFLQQHKKCTHFPHHPPLEIIAVSKNQQRIVKHLLCNIRQKFILATVMYCIAHDYYASVPDAFPPEKVPGTHCIGSWGIDGKVILNWNWGMWWKSMDRSRVPHYPCSTGTGGEVLWEWSWTFDFETMRELSCLAEDQLAAPDVNVG
jgi:hypothetical protein